ncbi:SH3 domain-containing protein 2 [Elsinoe australis]|uniref:SH3 domain-containing protein 2 n=1 Tax=Elsinoe australis TaxID=40998 RepID=A0A4U7B0U6_9PEZI|nr:SH3 domain-containing protein 2 [Elsinoe australis]
MAEVMQPQQTSSSNSTTPADESVPPPLSLDPIPRHEVLAHRLSSYSQSRSRHTSTVFPLFHSSLAYALVRDFAYPPYNPMHYGPIPDRHSTLSSPDGDYDSSRRVSDPPPWDASAGPWRDSSFDNTTGQQLPSTSFGLGVDDSDDDNPNSNRRSSRRISKHRKSKSYADMEAYTRGRRRSSREYKSSTRAQPSTTTSQPSTNSSAYVGYFSGPYDDRNDSAYSSTQATSNQQQATTTTTLPPFREDGESVPYSPSALEDHRPESASLDESFAGPSLALYDFSPENDNELELREGQIIQVGYRHGQGWLVAMNLETGEQGLVPEEYVRLLRDIEGWGDGPEGGVGMGIEGFGTGEDLDQGEETETEDGEGRNGSFGSERTVTAGEKKEDEK